MSDVIIDTDSTDVADVQDSHKEEKAVIFKIDLDNLPKVLIRKPGMERHPLKAIRAYCIDCSGGSSKYIKWCTCDGLHSTYCPLWPFRFGMLPDTALKRHGEQLLDPHQMPDADIDLDDLS